MRASVAAMFLAVLGAFWCAGAGPRQDQPTVVLITSSYVGAFEEAVEGVRSSLGTFAKIVIVDLSNPGALDQVAGLRAGKDTRLMVAVGNNALEAARSSGVPVIATMILRQDLASTGPPKPQAGAVV